jgi:hypothetical protein
VHTELDVTLSGPEGAMDARQALVRLEEVLDLLADLEDADRMRPSGYKRPQRSKWTFARLSLGSVRASLAPLRPGPGTTYDDLDAVNVRAVDGFAQVEDAEVLPEGRSICAARTARKLAGRLGATSDTGMRLSLIVDGKTRKTVEITRRSAVNLDRALQVRRESIGSITGSIDSMSVHKKPFLGLWSPRGGGRIRVEIPPNLVDSAREALGRRATVRGRIRRNASGQILNVRASRIDVLPPVDEAPPLSHMTGRLPWLTTGADPLSFLEAAREQAG